MPHPLALLSCNDATATMLFIVVIKTVFGRFPWIASSLFNSITLFTLRRTVIASIKVITFII